MGRQHPQPVTPHLRKRPSASRLPSFPRRLRSEVVIRGRPLSFERSISFIGPRALARQQQAFSNIAGNQRRDFDNFRAGQTHRCAGFHHGLGLSSSYPGAPWGHSDQALLRNGTSAVSTL